MAARDRLKDLLEQMLGDASTGDITRDMIIARHKNLTGELSNARLTLIDQVANETDEFREVAERLKYFSMDELRTTVQQEQDVEGIRIDINDVANNPRYGYGWGSVDEFLNSPSVLEGVTEQDLERGDFATIADDIDNVDLDQPATGSLAGDDDEMMPADDILFDRFGLSPTQGERTQEPMPDVMDRLADDPNAPGADGDGGGDTPGDTRMTDDGSPLPEYNGDMNWHNVPQDGELWKVDGEWALAYRSDVGGPYVYYTVGDNTDLERIFPEGMPEARELTQEEADRLGAINPGSHNLLSLDLGTNWEEGFNTTIERETLTSPWLEDGEVVATMLAATLEGRDVTEADLEGTDFFASRSDREIEYLAETATMNDDEYEQYHGDFRMRVRDSLLEAGVRNPDDTVVDFMARKWASGQWSDSHAAQQVIALSNPYSTLEMDSELENLTENMEFDTLGTRTRNVRNTVEQWLGPQHAQGYSGEWYEQWAGAIADDPNAENDLIDHLQGQRMSLYPEYDNPNLKYSDIAPVWENQMRQIWGTSAQNEEQWQVLDRVIRANDSVEAGKILRREGLKRGVQKVQRDAMTTMEDAFGSQVVRSF